MASSDDLFQALPLRTQRAIDFAFNVTVNPSFVRRSARNEPKARTAPTTGGGFILDDVPMGGGFIPDSTPSVGGGFIPYDVPSGGGGFLVDDEPMDRDLPSKTDHGAEDEEAEPSHIRLAQIPAALQRLDLPPDDPEVLAVFKNAASGWTSSSMGSSTTQHDVEPDEQYVSRDDFRSVCAVLLEHQPPDGGGDEDDDDAGSDEYQDERASTPSSGAEEVGQVDDSGSDEYSDSRPAKRRRVSKGKGKQRAIDLNTTLKLTTRQQQVCLETYAMIFPDIPVSELPKQRLMIKHIQASFKLIGETLKAEELMEMVDMFSTSPDKSMSFDDFGKMMIVAKLA